MPRDSSQQPFDRLEIVQRRIDALVVELDIFVDDDIPEARQERKIGDCRTIKTRDAGQITYCLGVVSERLAGTGRHFARDIDNPLRHHQEREKHIVATELICA